jgi:ABC-type oligopeptide transport system substrate-binding subunit
MKTVATLLLLTAFVWAASCSSKTHASHSDKKKMNDYNSIQYGNQKKKKN